MPLRFIQFITLVIFSAGIVRADLENFVVDKRTSNYQISSGSLETPKNGAFLDYYFELINSPDLKSASFSANLVQAPIQFQELDVWRGFVAFDTEADLQTTYYNPVFYDFTTQLGFELSKVSTGKFTSTANFTFATPQVSNFFDTSNINPALPFNLSLTQAANGLTGAGFTTYIQLTIIDPVSIDPVFVAQYDYTTLTLGIPAGTLESDRDYIARIEFISPDTQVPASQTSAYPVLSRYVRETWLRLRTTGTYDSWVPTLCRSYNWSQTDASTIATTPAKDRLRAWAPRPTADDLDAVTLAQLDVRNANAFTETPDDDDFAFTLELKDDALSNFVSGLITVGWRYDNDDQQMAFTNWELEPATVSPQILNWQQCQSLPPATDFTILVQRPDNLVGDITTTLVITDMEDEPVATISGSAGSGSPISVIMPAETLQALTPYKVSLTVENASNAVDGIDLKVAHVVDFTIETGLANWPGVSAAGIYYGTYFDNGTGVNETGNVAMVQILLEEDALNDLNQAVLNDPTSNLKATLSRTALEPTVFQHTVLYDSFSALLTEYPEQSYYFQTTQDAGTASVPYVLSVSGTAAPSIQVDFSHLDNAVDPSLAIPVYWSGINAASDGVQVSAYFPSGTKKLIPLENIAADGLSGQIPANALPTNSTNTVYLIFRRDLVVDSNSVQGAELVYGDAYFTAFPISTGEADYGNWLATFLNSAQLLDPTYTALTANPDGDALNNLQEFALNGNPLTPNTPPNFGLLGIFYTFEFKFRSDNPLLSYSLETSTTLTPPFTPYMGPTIVTAGDPYDTIRVNFNAIERLFGRLIIEYGAPNE